MTKTRARATKIQVQLRDLIAKVAELSNLVTQQNAVLVRLVPKPDAGEETRVVAHNEPTHLPSAHSRSLSTRTEAELTQLAFGPSTCAEPKVQKNPVRHPDLGTL